MARSCCASTSRSRAAAAALLDAAPDVRVFGAVIDAVGTVDLLLSRTVDPRPPWQAVSGHRWRLGNEVDLGDLAEDGCRVGQPCPAIAHLGSTPLDGHAVPGQLFLDLEAIGLLAVDAAADHATRVVRAIATGVLVSPLAETAIVVTTGLVLDGLGHPSLTSAETLDAALDVAASAIGTTAATTGPSLSTFTLRARQQGGEAWEPAIVFASPAADTSVDADLINLTQTGGRGLAVVVDRNVAGATWRAEQQLHGWMLHPLGLEFSPVGLTTADVDDIRAVLDEADRPLASDAPHAAFAEVGLVTAPDELGDHDLMVRVLGQVDVIDRRGRTAQFERSKALELVAWLSQHRERSTRGAARTALWESDVRDATFANVVSDARRSLARLRRHPKGRNGSGARSRISSRCTARSRPTPRCSPRAWPTLERRNRPPRSPPSDPAWSWCETCRSRRRRINGPMQRASRRT